MDSQNTACSREDLQNVYKNFLFIIIRNNSATFEHVEIPNKIWKLAFQNFLINVFQYFKIFITIKCWTNAL